MINKEDLKKYQIICTNIYEANNCLFFLSKLGFDTPRYGADEDYNLIIMYEDVDDKFRCYDFLSRELKYMNFYQFKELYEELTKDKDFIINKKGQITKINNYDSDTLVYYCNVFYNYILQDDSVCCVESNYLKYYNKSFLDKCINVGLLFNTKENAEKFLEYIKNYNKE